MEPPNLEDDSSDQLDRWVLDHGLPSLPSRLTPGRVVPIAYWAGRELGAVISIVDCEHDPYCDAEEHYVTSCHSYRRIGNNWQGAMGGSGTDWIGGVLPCLELRDDEVVFDEGLHGIVEDNWACYQFTGRAGRAVHWIELEQGGRVFRQRFDSKSAVFIVALSEQRPAEVRLLRADQTVLARSTVPPSLRAEDF